MSATPADPAGSARASAAIEAFRLAHGHDPVGAWAAPGRVNLIGEHTDYNDGFVLPLALSQCCVAAAAPAAGSMSTVRSVQVPAVAFEFSAGSVQPGEVTGWVAYVAGVFWSMRSAGHEVSDLDIVIDGDVPLGAGLSSSAAVECAVAVTIADLQGHTSDRTALALLAQKAENQFVGAPTGSMDQMASMHGQDGHLVFLDIRTQAVEAVPFDLQASDLALLVIDTRTAHALVDSEYAQRRSACERAARLLGLPALRDLDLEKLDDALAQLPQDVVPRVRHVVTENQRVLDVVGLLKSGADPRLIGPAMTASHASLRDDYEVTTPQLDLAVETALSAGAYGARMTGGGFGGCAIALVDRAAAQSVASSCVAAFAERQYPEPMTFLAVPSRGARRLV